MLLASMAPAVRPATAGPRRAPVRPGRDDHQASRRALTEAAISPVRLHPSIFTVLVRTVSSFPSVTVSVTV